MRLPALAGLFACVVIFAVTSSQVSAEALDPLQIKSTRNGVTELVALTPVQAEPAEPAPSPVEDKPKQHKVAENETLTAIAKLHGTTWQRLYAKNTQLEHPDVISVGDTITIPLPDEELAERALPAPPPAPVANDKPAQQPRSGSSGRSMVRGSSSGNRYVYGYCTWYAKQRRPDLPNNLGNAITWVSRARAQGLPTGSTPRAGAIGQQGNHVVYVERVNTDGTVLISEMNFRGRGVVSSRTVPASYFQYIY